MPLRDHFHEPLSKRQPWEAMHHIWPSAIVFELFDKLPKGFEAVPDVHLGTVLESDVATYNRNGEDYSNGHTDGNGDVATLTKAEPTLVLELDMSEEDETQVRIYDANFERKMVATIEIVSPSNKDRPSNREAFVHKVNCLLKKGVCVSIIDIVSNRHANFFAELLAMWNHKAPALQLNPETLYVATLRVLKQARKPDRLEAWYVPPAFGDTMPTLPLWLSEELRFDYSLEPSYERCCRTLHLVQE